MASEDSVDSNALGVDDVCINNVEMFRLERMTDTCFWICCYKQGQSDDDRIVFWVTVVDEKLIVQLDKEWPSEPIEMPT